MKKILSILSAGAILLGLASCAKEEVRVVFDPGQSTAPVIESFEEVEGDVMITFTPGSMNINQKIANHWIAITSLEGQPVSKSITSSITDGVAKVTAGNLAKALVELGCEDGSKANLELVVRASPLSKNDCRDDEPTNYIDSQERVALSDYAVVLPSGDPYARYTDLSEWGLVGSITNWGNPADDGTVIPDVEIWTNGTLHVAKGVELKKGDEIKFRKNSSWDENLGYGEGVTGYELDMEFDLSQGGPNIVVAEDGVYDLILDPEAKTAKIITSVAPAPDPYAEFTEESEWGLVGSFSGWGNDPDVVMYTNGTLHVAKAVSLKAGDMVKFRKNSSWDENFGLVGPESSDWPMDEEFDLEAGGGNIIISEDGTYDLILNPEAKTAKIIKSVVPAGDPYASYTEESPWSLIGSFNSWGGDVAMVSNGTLHVAKAVALNKGAEVKFRKDKDWTVNFGLDGAASADWPFGEEFPVVQDGGNIIMQEDGVFDFILDPDNATAKIIKSVAPEAGDTPEPEPKPEVWSLIGTINGTGWDTDFDLTNTSGDVWEIKNVAFEGGELFKIRADHDWGKNYGGPEATIEIPKEDGSTEGAYEAEIGKTFAAGGVNIYIAEEGAYNITFTYGDEPTILIEEYKEFPDALYMVGTDFGNWNWSSDGVVELTPVLHNPEWGANAEGQWWTIRYLTAGNGVKFNGVRDWNGTQFGSLDTNEGFTNDGDGNVVVAESGLYMIHIDLKRSILHVEAARVFLIGETVGGAWDENLEAGAFTANPDGSATLVKELPAAGTLRMYAASSISTSPWWTREFTILDGKIQHRLMNELSWPTAQKAQKVILNFNAGTGSIEGEGEAPQYKTEITVPGSYSGANWNVTDDPKLLGKGDGVFKGALVMTTASGGNAEFKFGHDGSWISGVSADEVGAVSTDPSFTLYTGDNMSIAPGTYFWTVNLPEKTAKAIKVTKVELMGSFDGWSNGIELSFDSEANCYTGSVTLDNNAEIKVRFNQNWDLGMAGTLDRLSAVADGNITVADGGTYMISLDLNAGKLYLNR